MLSSVTVPIVGQWIFYCRHPKTIASTRIYGLSLECTDP